MAFPSTVIGSELVSGIPGEISFDAPYTGIAAVVNSTNAANNVFGRAFTYNDQSVETIQAGGDGVFAGILVNPKTHAIGVIDGTAVDTIPNGYQAEVMHEGECYVSLIDETPPAIGAPIFFVNATGAIGSGTAGAGQTQIVGGKVFRHIPSTALPMLATIRIKN